MRIAFIVEKFPVLSETFILSQITGLIKRGHQVHIYSHYCNDQKKVHEDVHKFHLLQYTYYSPRFPKDYFRRFIKALGLILIYFPQAPIKILSALNVFKYGKYAASLKLLYSIIPFLKSAPYDIIHAQFGMHGIEGMMYREIGVLQGKLITSFRGYDISWYLKEEGNHVYDQLFVKGDLFFANCHFFRDRVVRLGCDRYKIIVHGSGVDPDQFRFRRRYFTNKVCITTVGRLIEKKGIEYGIRAVKQVLDIYPHVEYKIIGDGYLKEYLQDLIDDLNIASKVKLLGWRNRTEIVDILDRSHIFIAPSVTAANGNQDAPVNTLKEAMLMGLPVIGTYHGGIPELIEDGVSGFLVPTRDSDAIAQKIIYLIEHPEIWEKIGKNGCSYVKATYDIDKLNDQLVEIYRQLIEKELPVSKLISPTLERTAKNIVRIGK
ncbi:MAG: glycosyltransferase [Mastigocoleus sp.]